MLSCCFEKYFLIKREYFFYILILFFASLPAQALNAVSLTEIYNNNACIDCHQKNNAELVNDWRASAHASTQPVTDCIACHGDSHKDSASTARQNNTCTDCHGGKTAAVVASYSSSQHGAIMQMEQAGYNWQQALAGANYRVPGCSYCHLHEANHNLNRQVISNQQDKIDEIKLQSRNICQDCHSRRYITQLLDNGERMLEIARKKFNEAEHIIRQASVNFSETELLPVTEIKNNMQKNLNNVYLGAAHQSPSYQWWYGQSELDGDLLRIKGNIGELYRNKKIKPH